MEIMKYFKNEIIYCFAIQMKSFYKFQERFFCVYSKVYVMSVSKIKENLSLYLDFHHKLPL